MEIDALIVRLSDAYRSFLTVHTATNRIRLYMEQIPRYVETWSRHFHRRPSSAASAKLLSQMTDHIERIGTNCTTLIEESAGALDDLKSLLNEILKVKNTFETTPPKKSNDELEPSRVTTTTKKPKKRGKGKKQQRSQKISNATNNSSALCETMPDNAVDSLRVFLNATEAFLSIAESFSSRRLPVPRVDEFTTKWKELIEVLNSGSFTSPEHVNEASQNLLRGPFSMLNFSNAYYKISQKFIMTRLAGLSLMLTARTDDDRNSQLKELCNNRTIIENELRNFIRQIGQEKIDTTTTSTDTQ